MEFTFATHYFSKIIMKKANIDPKILTIGYWNFRGLGAPLRMMAMYSG
jgi:hypothetical protein